MPDMQPYRQTSSLDIFPPRGRTARAVTRQLTTIQARTAVRTARLEAKAEEQATALVAVAYVGRCAMQSAALLSQVETQLATAVPHASGRLAVIADLTALALSEVVADTARTLRQC